MVNGCGTSGGFPVPDYLVSPVSPAVALAFGGIFRDACNAHDMCYSLLYRTKAQCDLMLEQDMIQTAQQQIPAVLRPVFASAVSGQSYAYSRTLLWEGIFPWNTSQSAFDAAQNDARCRMAAADFQWNGCN